ncbi:DUF1983 domain-containing protein [Pseudomonas sp. NFACC37-1]|uniref:phage tail tip fiber protein n=1 Tax=Pseudomonas sp. NFACC37-1 TaxID=1566196 RepID=UPI00088AE763|nr:DUF1983 domain-containing protein [Pseudomonas sp. NFACC37-1]SCZ13310.1 protein of unknown function [Pseudomonas sp. NFACC37-1]
MSKHVTIEELLKQIADNTAAIKQESTARAGAEMGIASHIGVMNANLPNSIQSQDYVQGFSGLKLDQASGDFEINSCTIGSASKAPKRQVVSVEVASYSKWDLPKNAANLLQFMEAELQKVPEEYRHAAEFEEFDASYGDDSFSSRLFLSYSRLETEEELAERLKKAKVAGTRIVKAGGCTTIICDGVVRINYGNLDAPLPEPEPTQPLKVGDGQVFISEAFIKDGSITTPKLDPMWSVKMQLNANGQYIAAGIASQILTDADRFAIKQPTAIEKAIAAGDVTKVLDLLAGKLNETELSRELKEQIDRIGTSLDDTVRGVIRAELKPGGLLHRSN